MTAAEKKEAIELCRKAANGSEKARRKLMGILFKRIHNTASYLASSCDDAEDLTQTACTKVLLYAGSYDGTSSLTFFADRITLLTAAKILTRKKSRRKILDVFYQTLNEARTTEEMTGDAFVRRRLIFHLRGIKYTQREVLMLRFVYRYSIVDVANLCRISVETALSRLTKGRSILLRKVKNDAFLKEWVQKWR